jgi:putative ABC transport system permease protein
MMAWSVSERRQEFAIRLALGARSPLLVRMVLRKALLLAGAGLIAGLVAARAATGVLTGLLYGIRPSDPAAFAATAGVIALVALAACYVPVRRALRVNPVSLLR